MATVAGSIKSLSNGIFHVKDENGNVRELKVGDEIHENDTIYGDSANSASSKVEIQLSGNDVIVLSEGQKQLIDSSLIETAFGTEELFFTKDGLDLKADNHNSDADVVSDLRDAEFNGDNNKDITEEATAEGKKEAEDETTVTGEFQARDGNATDIVSDLRNAQFKARTQVFEDKSAFESESKDRLSSLENTDRPSYTTPTVIQITPSTPPVQQVVTPPPPAAPIIVIGNLSVNDITQYESEGFLIFTVTLDRPVASPVTFDYKTSPITASPNGKDYTDVFGKITIPAGSTSVTIKVPITDDYVSDNGETIKMTITNVVGNATITKPEGIGTILDNPVNNPGNGTPNTPKELGGYGEEDTVYAVIVGPGTVNEGNITTDYIVKLIDKDGNPVVVTKDTNVTVKYINIDTEDNDTQYKNNDKITVTIKAGTSSNTFKVETKDDYISDNNEKYNLSIEKVNTNEFENVVIGDKSGNNKDVTTTILDNPSTTDNPTVPTDPTNPNNPDDGINYGEEDSVYAIITGAVSVNEGNTTTYTVKLVDKDGNPVIVTKETEVTIKYTNVTTQDGDTEFNNNNTIIVKIPANGSTNTFTVESIDDYLADNGEKYNVAITKVDTNEFENVVIGDKSGNNKDVTTTILDDTDNTPNNPNDGVESNHESVIIKLVACDASGSPILESDGKTYKIVNEVNEGANAKYMALAFEPNTTTFTTETKLSLQGGTVTVDTANGTAIGVPTQIKEDGTEDYILVDDKVVNVGVAFEIVTVDDYISDNNEIYTVSINSASYTHPTTPIYENVEINTQAVTTTIKDNSNPNDSTPYNPNDPTNHNQESDKEIVLIKLFAADENGNVIKDGNGNYLLANEAEEGTNANYIAYAFKEGTTTFNDSTKLDVQTGTVDISFHDNTASGATTKTLTDGTQDFNNSAKTSVTIGQSFSTEVFKDLVSESTEKYTVTIDNNSYSGNYESVNIDTNPVTTTIHEEKLFVKIEPITDTTNEGGNLKYKVVIVNKDGEEVKVPAGKTLTVDLSYEGNTSKEATVDEDYTPKTSITIIGGTSYTEFEVTTKDDYYAEGDEGLKITINNIDNSDSAFENIASHTTANGASSDKITATGTIKDNPANKDTSNPETPIEPTSPNDSTPKYGEEDTVYVVISGNDTKYEGGILEHTIKLVDKDGNLVTIPDGEEITVTIVYTEGTIGATKGTDYTATETVTFTSTTGNTITIENPTKDDYIADNNESYTATIGKITQKDGTFENIESGYSQSYKTSNPSQPDGKSVTGTILDDTDATPNNPDDGGTKETNHEQVILKIVACDASGNPLFEADGKTYKTTSNVSEGDKGYYKVFAFAPNTTEFTSDTKLPDALQGGTVTVSTSDISGGATSIISTATQNKFDGTQDYKSQSNVSVTVGTTVFQVQTLDDYKAETEANETFKVTIDTTSYTHPTTPIYENVKIDNAGVITTIVDNVAAKNQTIQSTSTIDNGTTSTYGAEDTVYAVITADETSVIEGNKVTYTVKLVDKDGNNVKVNSDTEVTIKFKGADTNGAILGDLLKIFSGDSNSTTEISGGFDTTKKELNIKIPANSSSTKFTIQTKDDFTTEGNESFDLSISDINSTEFENLVFDKTKAGADNKTTTTIKDGVTIYKDEQYIVPENAVVDEDRFDVTQTDSKISNQDTNAGKPNGTLDHQGQYLNIIKPNEDDNYSLIFDGLPTVYKGSSDNFDYGDSRGTALQSGGLVIEYVVNGNTITGYKGTGRDDADKVFDIVLNKDSSISSGTTTKDNYKYTQYKNIDHPVNGDAANSVNDDNITFEFGFKITDQGSTSDVVKFKVTVNDSLPKTSNWIEEVNEDGSKKIVISPESFAGGYIEISNGTMNGSEPIYYKLGKTASGDIVNKVDIYDPDLSKVVGELTTSADGTVLFTPNADYSNYDYTKNPSFSYKVSDFDGDTAGAKVEIKVKPVADAPTITFDTGTGTMNGTTFVVTTTEDDVNTKEGTHKVDLGLKVPALSKDQTDQDSGKGDNPERNGEITLTFTNGLAVTGAKLFNGSSEVATISSDNQPVKIVIVKTSGGNVDDTYHHADVTTGQANTLYLTKAEYEALKIQHAEDNDTDIKIKISVTSYEVDDNGKPLNAGDSTYSDKTNTNLSKTTTADMTVKINPATDDIKLEFVTATDGTISQTDRVNDTFTFSNPINEGSGAINLNNILSNTSGALNVTGDLDGSEKRTYTISGIPEGTIVKIGSTEAVAGKDGKATLTFKDAQNILPDPDFTMEFPKTFGGGVKATITLSVQDKGADAGDTAGAIRTETVYLNIDVEPVATTPNINIIQVSQAIGYEDDGRSNGNSATPNDTINANGAGGIPLKIKVSSDDTDGSEKANIKITDIPSGAKLYYNGVEVTPSGSEYIINEFDNSEPLVFIPPHNDDTDYTLKVQVQFVDTVTLSTGSTTTTSAWSDTKDIDVIVKNIADAPVGTELKANINVNEDSELNLKDIYSNTIDNNNFKSSDNSEELTVKIKLTDGFTIKEGTPYFIDNGEYVVKAQDIIDGKIIIIPPKDFSGNASFDLTYVTTEKAGENDSKTWHTDKVNIFVNPVADDVNTTNSTTMYEDIATKVDLTAILKDSGTTNGTETIDAVYVSKATIESMITQGYILTVNEVDITSKGTETITPLNGTNAEYYVLTYAEADQISVINTNTHKINGDFSLNVAYKVTDTNGVSSDPKDFTHDHKVIVKAVTDQPSLTVNTITGTDVTIDGKSKVTVNNDTSANFTVNVKTESPDKDESEKVQEIIISGVPQGVSIENAEYMGYSGSVHNGIWVIRGTTNLTDKDLDDGGASKGITFKVNQGANFDNRPITITTYTKDEATADTKIESASQTIYIVKNYEAGTGTGTPADLELATKVFSATEDTEFSLGSMLEVKLKENGNGGAVITISDIPEGSKITGYDYSYVEGGKTFYVVVGNGNVADMNTKLSNVKITPPKDMNSDQEGVLKGDFKFTANIATHHNGTYNGGNTVNGTNKITPVTDEMTIAINVADTNEDTATALTITLSNPSDATKTTLVGNSLIIKISETWEDDTTGGVGTKGTLTDPSGKYNVVYNSGTGTYTITPKNVADNFKVDTPIIGLVYTPAANRDGSVNFEVSVQNKEGDSIDLTSKGETTIKVTPVIDMKPNVTVVTATGIEDTPTTINGTTLQNAIKLNVSTTISADSSEQFQNIILDEVPNGFTVWYKDSGNNLVMATNIGKSGTGTFDLTPNISTDSLTHENKWLVPSLTGGVLPDIYINAPTNWSGDFDFKAQFTLKEQNLTTSEKTVVNVTGKIEAVADGVTIDPTLTFGDAFSWVDLKLNVNMKDVDGSETMSLELIDLGANAQFRDSKGVLTSATYDETSKKWTITGIKYDEINKIQFTNDKDVNSVGVKAWTVEAGMLPTDTGAKSSEVNSAFNLDIKDVGGILELDKGINLDFSKLETTSLKGINSIDLSKAGENKLENLKLSDVLNMTNDKGELIIKGDIQDKVTFANNNGWSKGSTETIDSKTFDIYSNSGDTSVQVKVEQNIQDQII